MYLSLLTSLLIFIVLIGKIIKEYFSWNNALADMKSEKKKMFAYILGILQLKSN